jgi:hypothetical protein
MNDCRLYFELRNGRSFRYFLDTATIDTDFEIDMPFPLFSTSLCEVYHLYTKGLFVHLARRLRFDRSNDGKPATAKELLRDLSFPTNNEVYDQLERLSHERTRLGPGYVYKKLHLRVPTLLNLWDKGYRESQFERILEDLDRSRRQDSVAWLKYMHDANIFWSLLPPQARSYWLENNPGLRTEASPARG